MRILYICSYYKPAYVYGGPVKCVSAMCETLAGLGQGVTVLTTNANGAQRLDVPLGKSIDVKGVDVVYYPISAGFPSSFFYSPTLAKALKQRVKEFDIVEFEVLFSHGLGSATAACRKNGVPYIITPHGQLLPWSLSHKRLKKLLFMGLLGRNYLNHAAALHCTDSYEVEAIRKLKLHSPCFVIPNGIDLSKFTNIQERSYIRGEFRIPLDSIVLLFMGRLHRKKRPDIAIQAFAMVKSVYPNAYLLMCGPDEEGLISDLKADALALGCSESIIFPGLIEGEKVPRVMADSDLFIMPSEPQSENFGMSAVEALAAGVPILVSEGVPIGYRVEKMGAGRVVPTTSTAFGEAAVQMLSDRTELKDMGRRGQKYVQQNFDIVTVARKMLRQYEKICSTGYPLPDDYE